MALKVAEIKVGDRIAYCTSETHCSAAFVFFGDVEKVQKNGIVVLKNGLRFGKTGYMIKSQATKFPRGYIMDFDHASEIMKEHRHQRDIHSAVNALMEVIARRKRGDGQYRFSTKEVEAMDALVGTLLEDGGDE
jgi:hypothetical protein